MQPIESTQFRAAMARLGSAVTLVTTDGVAGRRGLAATAVTSITDTPPNVLVCVNKSARSNAMIKQNGVFAVNVLSGMHEHLVGRFSGMVEGDPFADEDLWGSMQTGAPTLHGSLTSLDCTLDQMINIGTHSLFIGTVVAVAMGESKQGLIYFDKAMHTLGED